MLAFDLSYVPKSGERTEGLGHFWNGGTGRAKRGLEVNALSWIDVTDNTAYPISASLNIRLCTQEAATGQPSIANADRALYEVKQQGRGHYRFFAPVPTATMVTA